MGDSFQLKLKFEHPLKISQLAQGPDRIIVTLKNTDWIISLNNEGKHIMFAGTESERIPIPK